MNYKKLHDKIINKARSEKREPSEIYTIHHILPRSMGGLDVDDNKVLLTPKEHYIIHRVFARTYKQKEVRFLVNNMSMGMKGDDSPKLSILNYYIKQLHILNNCGANNNKIEARRKTLKTLMYSESVKLLSLPHFNPATLMKKVEFI